MPKNKKFLVTGSQGFIGSHAVEHLIKNGFEVVALDNLSNFSTKKINPKATFIEADISDERAIKNIFLHHDIHAIFHFAAAIEAGESMKNPNFYYQNNVVKTLSFIGLVMKYSSKSHFIFSSSAAIYAAKNSLIKEEDEKNPANIYGKTKLIVENALSDFAKAHNFSCAALRYFNVCGANYQNNLGENRCIETHLIPLLLKALNQKNTNFVVNGNNYQANDGSCVRDYIHVEDVCEAQLKTLNYLEKSKGFKAFNIGSGRGYSVLQIIKKAEEITGKKIVINFKERRSGDADCLVASLDLAFLLLDWKPRFSDIENIIFSAWQWEKTSKLTQILPKVEFD